MEKQENRLMTGPEVAEYLNTSRTTAYKIIRQLNEELEQKGFYTLRGKVSRKYLNERFFGEVG